MFGPLDILLNILLIIDLLIFEKKKNKVRLFKHILKKFIDCFFLNS